MQKFQHVLVPTDFEAPSAKALDTAISLARAFDAKLTLLHVWELPVYPYADFALTTDVVNSMEQHAAKRLAESLESLRKLLPNAQSSLKMGAPYSCILDAIKESGADLVVMATHGRRGMSHLLLGSVAEKVVRLSPVPVLTVRSSQSG